MLSAKVSAKNQIALPSEMRKRMGIQPGDRLIIELVDDRAVVSRRPGRASDRLWGLGRGLYGDDPTEYVRRLRDEWEARQRERDALVGR